MAGALMAATVASIITQAKAIAAAKLGAGWQELPRVLDLDGLDARRGAKGYGVRPLSASNTPTVTNAYALDHGFQLILTDTNPRKDDDSQALTVIGVLFDQMDEIYKEFVRAKMNLGGTVLLVGEPSLSEPEFISGKEIVALRQNFNVKYRQTI